jgi:N-acetyl-anhydromuramyl-L-alanine amidase AmpD
MKIIDVTKQLPFRKSNGGLDLKKVNKVVVHHDGSVFDPKRGYNTMQRIKGEAAYHVKKGYGHLSYHYVIDNVGDVYRCLPENEVGYHCGNLAVNKNSLAICLHGNFMVQQPTVKQLASLKELIQWLSTQRPDLPKVLRGSFVGHRNIKATSCPGDNLYKLLKKL